jgi:hypothetical protein
MMIQKEMTPPLTIAKDAILGRTTQKRGEYATDYLEIPGEVLLGLKVPRDEAGATVRMAAAMKLCKLGQLSSGAAARLAG